MNKIRDEDMAVLSSAVRINLENGTRLNIEIEEVTIPLKSTFIGMESNQYLILSYPTPFAEIKNKLFSGNHIIVKYFSRGTVYAFQSKVVYVMSKPVNLLFLEYPKIIQRQDLRSQKRMSCCIPARLTAGEEETHGSIMDISKGGCRYQVRKIECANIRSLDVDEEITLNFPFPGKEGEIEVFGDTKSIRHDRNGLDLGIMFYRNPPDIQNSISQYILSVYDFI